MGVGAGVFDNYNLLRWSLKPSIEVTTESDLYAIIIYSVGVWNDLKEDEVYIASGNYNLLRWSLKLVSTVLINELYVGIIIYSVGVWNFFEVSLNMSGKSIIIYSVGVWNLDKLFSTGVSV